MMLHGFKQDSFYDESRAREPPKWRQNSIGTRCPVIWLAVKEPKLSRLNPKTILFSLNVGHEDASSSSVSTQGGGAGEWGQDAWGCFGSIQRIYTERHEETKKTWQRTSRQAQTCKQRGQLGFVLRLNGGEEVKISRKRKPQVKGTSGKWRKHDYIKRVNVSNILGAWIGHFYGWSSIIRILIICFPSSLLVLMRFGAGSMLLGFGQVCSTLLWIFAACRRIISQP